MLSVRISLCCLFFFNDTATTEIYTLSLHDALPIYAFNGGLALALARRMPLVDAVREACLVGALSVTRLGAQPSLPNKEELDAWGQIVNSE